MTTDITASSTFTMLVNLAEKEAVKSSAGRSKHSEAVENQEQQPSKSLTPKKPSLDMGLYLSQVLSSSATEYSSPMDK